MGSGRSGGTVMVDVAPARAATGRRRGHDGARLRALSPEATTEVSSAWVTAVLTLLSNGLVDEAAAQLDGVPDDAPAVRLLVTDIRCSTFATTAAELGALREDAARWEPDGGPLSSWAAAITAEHLLVTLDPMAPVVAATALATVPADPLPAFPTAYARARLLRVASLAAVALPSRGCGSLSRRHQDEAVSLLRRYGLHTEVAVTCALVTAARAIWAGEDPPGAYELLLDARRRLPERPHSLWTAMLDFGVATIAVMLRDLPGAVDAIERLEAAAPPGLPGAFPAQGRAYLRLLTEGFHPEVLDQAWQAGDATAEPLYRGLYLRHVASLLADLGRPEAARFARPALALPALGPLDALERRLLEARLDTLEGRQPDLADLLATLGTLAAEGRPRPAAMFALQLAHDAHRAGAAEAAEALHSWGRATAPDAAGRITAEAIAARALGAPMPGAAGGAPAGSAHGTAGALRLEVLRPALEARRDGVPIALPPTASTLLIALAHAHPLPLHAEAVNDILWPDRPPRLNRLNTLVHRLRTALGGDAPVVVRDGPLLRLDERHCDVDLWEYRRALQGSAAARARALASVRGNLCDAQLPYNEHLVTARHQLLADWLHHAGEVLRDGRASAADLSPAATALGAGDELAAWRTGGTDARGRPPW